MLIKLFSGLFSTESEGQNRRAGASMERWRNGMTKCESE